MAVPVRMRASVAGTTPGTVVETSYEELALPGALSRSITCAWIGTPGAPHELRVIPDGGVDVAWDGERITVTRSLPEPVRLTVGHQPVVGARLRPGVAGDVLGTDISALPAVTDLADLWAPSIVDRLVTELARLPMTTRPAALARVLAQSHRTGDRHDVVVPAARAIEAGADRVGPLASRLGIGERHLRRRFEVATGLSLATYRRIVRLQRFLRLADRARGTGFGLRDLAAAAGYSDQAHLSRECRSLTGSSPARLLRQRAGAG